MNSNENRKYGAMISVVNMIVTLVFGLLYTPYMIRCLGKSEYGVWTLASSLVSYLTMLDLGFGNAIVRFSSRYRAQGKDEKNLHGMFLLFYLVVSVVALVAGMVIYNHLDSFFQTSFTNAEVSTLQTIYLIMLANIVISFPASIFSSIIRSHEQFVFINGLNLVQGVLQKVVTLIFLLQGYKSIMMVTVTLVFTILTALFNMIFCFKKLHIRFGFEKMEKEFYKEVFGYSFFILLNMIIDRLYESTDNIILGKLVGSTSVAIYGVGILFHSYFLQFSTSISGVFLPHISKLSTKDAGIDEISKLFLKVGHIQFVMLSFVLTGFIVFGREFIYLWVGPSYDDAYIIALLAMAPALIPLSQNLGISVLQAYNKHKVRSIMYLLIAILNVAVSIPLAKKYGGIGAAMGTALGNLLGQILFMNWYYDKKMKIDIPSYWKEVGSISLKMVPLGLMFYGINLLIKLPGWKGMILKIALSCLVAFFYERKFVLTDFEKNLFTSFIKRHKRA